MNKPTENQIAAWKKKYQEIFAIEVAESEPGAADGLYFIFRRPDRKILSAASSVDDELQAADIVLKNTLVFGDASALEDMAVFESVAQQFKEINKPRVSQLKKL